MPPESTWSIGELAEHAGVTVKTVRFYSDRGLLPEAARSTGGHRRYGPEALDRLRLIRSLRNLDLPVPHVGRILDQEDAMEDVIAWQLREIGSQLAALRWREAALQLLQDCAPEERADRLRLIGAVSAPPSTAALARFWRHWLPPRLPAHLVSAIIEQAVPQLPEGPTPAQALAFARLHALVSAPCVGADRGQPAAHRPDKGYRPAVLYDGLGEAYALATPELRAQRPPSRGEALDCFVSAYAHSLGTRDTPAFRHQLSLQLAADPRIDRYWQLTAELSGPSQPTPGAAHDWLCAALDTQIARPAA
ncbi:MerR family transcriptional regulator [Streptomyces sp. NBC_01142]|uniref:helix-turn-helix domain-containing protein n=1 Tax=Streptomyces sp. NBC_01142 TaxID=2975865 RepID=UPI002259AAC6|nr:MerR family transcriptional regulator [Streptomyces sp. NBC_01142]MCX4821281.1 MerR family transcriptional regulator [Streptomyces sp. NBC_01142]